MDSYSIDLRKRVLEDCDAGSSTRQVALKYRVSESWVRRLKQRQRELGEIAARSRAISVHPFGCLMWTVCRRWLPSSPMRRCVSCATDWVFRSR